MPVTGSFAADAVRFRLVASGVVRLDAAFFVPPARLRAAAEGLALPEPRPGRPLVPNGITSASATVSSQRAGNHGLDVGDAVAGHHPGSDRPAEVLECRRCAVVGLEPEHR